MTTTAAGDAAVARLNNATGAFEEIITGASNQVVDVPGYGNQPTLAARVDQRLDETTATAAAEANRSRDEADRSTNQATAAANSVTLATAEYNKAKNQADRAQSEADRASQISGLDNVAEAVGLAAIPFPDVWIPLSDSLRMLAGYGREVKVGDDVVANHATLTRNSAATMVNKSLSLAPVAINEARFEREGVVIEPKRTNIIKIAESYNPNPQGGVTSVSKTQIMGFNFVKQVNDGTGTGSTTTCSDTFDIKAGDTIVYQAVFKLPDSGEQAGRFRCRVGNSGGFAFDLSFYNELSNDREPSAANNKIEKSQPYSDKTLVRVVRSVTVNEDYTGCFLQLQSLAQTGVVNAGCHHAELATYATSYIPTNGSAVTRTADKLTIPRLNNDCAEWYSGPDQITPIVTADTIELVPPAGKRHLRNVRGFFTPLTPAQKAALK
ncbi:hypothetical protein ACK39D_05255 [Aeromonas veronii]